MAEEAEEGVIIDDSYNNNQDGLQNNAFDMNDIP